MKNLWEILKRNSAIVAWVFFGFAVGFSFLMADQSREDTRRLVCLGQLETALTIRDILDFSVGENTSPEARELIQRFYDRVELPPKICKGTGVDVSDFFRRPNPFP